MAYYMDIILKSDDEFSLPTLMNAICAKLHKVLFDLKSENIGVSFPNYDETLGNTLRIHGSEIDLIKFQGMDWLGGMSGYCKLSNLLPVPTNAKHRTVGRKQANMSQAKLNRLLKRGKAKQSSGITEDKVKKYKAKMLAEKGISLPYIDLVSNSNGKRHRRYIQLGDLLDKPVLGEFDQFGFSKTATVPWF